MIGDTLESINKNLIHKSTRHKTSEQVKWGCQRSLWVTSTPILDHINLLLYFNKCPPYNSLKHKIKFFNLCPTEFLLTKKYNFQIKIFKMTTSPSPTKKKSRIYEYANRHNASPTSCSRLFSMCTGGFHVPAWHLCILSRQLPYRSTVKTVYLGPYWSFLLDGDLRCPL